MKLFTESVPSGRSRSKRVWVVLLAVALLAGGGAAWYFLSGAVQGASAESEETLQTATVRRGGLRISISGTGSLVSNQTVDLGFSTSGTLIELNAQEGQSVAEGEVLARIGGLEALENTLANAELAVLEAQKALTDLQESADLTLAEAFQAWISAKAAYQDAALDAERTASSRCSQETNAQNTVKLERAEDRMASLEEDSEDWIIAKYDYDTALANYNYCISYTDEEKLEAGSNLEIASLTLAKAEAAYNQLATTSGIDANELAIAEATLKAAETKMALAEQNLEGATLIAPMDGKVTYVADGVGAIVSTDTFLSIADLSTPMVEVYVDESDLSDFVAGRQVEVVFDALPDEVFTGTIVHVNPELVTDSQVQMVNGLVQLDPDASQLLQSTPLGLNAGAEIIVEEVSDALLIPVEALRDLGDGSYAVFVVADDGQLKFRAVEVGIIDIIYAEIISGLEEGDIVSTGLVATSIQ